MNPQADGRTITFEAICPAGTANIPYKIISHTKGKPEETCTEIGTLKVKRSWKAIIKVESYKSKFYYPASILVVITITCYSISRTIGQLILKENFIVLI